MPTNARDYTVGWICAIETEYAVACELLDEEYKDGSSQVDQRDPNIYTFGRIHQHNVVIACLPTGRYGLTSAALVAERMRWNFPAIRFGLMVGIAGGAPSDKHDIRLGDVVVSSPTPKYSGVLQYDFGKAIQDHEFEETSHLAPPPEILLNALSKIRTQHKRRGHKISRTIDEWLKKNDRLSIEYSKPDIKDELYKESYIHLQKEVCDCQIDNRDWIEVPTESITVDRRERDSKDDGLHIHYGLIASANRLMKDATARNTIARKHDVLCFEMEAAGLMIHFPCVVIRGICDYSDTHKNDRWHGYAAATAAAYAKELLEVIPGADVESMQPESVPRPASPDKPVAPGVLLHQEATFLTPHFTFNTPGGGASQTEDYDESKQTKETQLLYLSRDSRKDLPRFLGSNAQLSIGQSLCNSLSGLSLAGKGTLIRTNDRARAAGWLLLIEQLWERNSIHYKVRERGCTHYTLPPVPHLDWSHIDQSYIDRNPLNVFDENMLHLPAIRCEPRSWDLQSQSLFVSRPLASIELRDLLTICFRLRIRVEEYKGQAFRASAKGHTFSPLTAQGAELVVEYRYDASATDVEPRYPGNGLFAPTEATDQLAFGIIPSNLALGISRSWDLQQGDMVYSMNEHWEALGISEKYRRILRSELDSDKNDIREVYGDTVYMLAPILSLDGLGIVKYQSPLDGRWSMSMMVYRECRIVLRTRLNELRNSPMVDQQTIWISDLLNELADRINFTSPHAMYHRFGRNAEDEYQHQSLHFLRTKLKKADEFLSQTCKGEYTNLVAAHIEMAVEVLGKTNQAVREKKVQNFRTDNTVGGISSRICEVIHCYIDAALKGRISELYRSKASGQALNDQQVRMAWFTMILRGILWQACHHSIALPQLPFESKFYRDRTMVMIA